MCGMMANHAYEMLCSWVHDGRITSAFSILFGKREIMILKIKPLVNFYLGSWWMSWTLCLLSLTIFLWGGEPIILFFVLFLGVVVSFCYDCYKRCWIRGLFKILMIPVCLFALVASIMMAPQEAIHDPFADQLTIPSNIEVAEPQPRLVADPGISVDLFQKSLLDALNTPGGDDPTITANVSSLASLARNHPDILKRYLASKPAWRLYDAHAFLERHARVYATRRWALGTEWHWVLNGVNSNFMYGKWPQDGLPPFQTRCTICFSGKPWRPQNRSVDNLKEGETAPLKVEIMDHNEDQPTSQCVIKADPLVVEVMEVSNAKERRLTKASLAQIEKELAPLAANPSRETIRSLLPEGSIREGIPSLELRKDSESGYYNTAIWVNPGESGMIYLKAFEVTKGTPLSLRGNLLKGYSNEWIGWSDNPKEQFFANSLILVCEGDPAKPYAARFEVWFTPDSGAPDRKLLEKVFKILGPYKD